MFGNEDFGNTPFRDEADFDTHVNYIHYNPVKHGVAARVTDWPHSSFHRFVKLGLIDAAWAGDSSVSEISFGEGPGLRFASSGLRPRSSIRMTKHILLDRLCVLQLLNPLFTQAQNFPEHFTIMRADPGRRTRGAGF